MLKQEDGMPIFISYSRRDSDFVDRLANQLVQHKVNIWLDRWEIHVGDSLMSRVQDAISGASALLVILSRSSVESAWCEKEINGGLIRELEERRTILLPVLIEDCRVPIFLREKAYADFRGDFDMGLRTILEAIARVTNANTGRIDEPQYHTDWALDWGKMDERAMFRYTIVEQAQGQPYTVVSVVEVIADREATRAYDSMVRATSLDRTHRLITRLMVDAVNSPDELIFLLEDQFERTSDFAFSDGYGDFYVRVSARRLGADTGRDVQFRIGNQLRQILEHMVEVSFSPREGRSPVTGRPLGRA
ncbi:toll/interleukin-1 receptor domain-containing protein [Microbispora hainanensis]|uniref:toll/interleukin-1 receptor domain-containing protein n=1 Tax=Microbispora hainanensis TaxID=568844 RepID=UPI0033F2BA6D